MSAISRRCWTSGFRLKADSRELIAVWLLALQREARGKEGLHVGRGPFLQDGEKG
jgi:hypothetical protein